jgi:hypothetical protein
VAKRKITKLVEGWSRDLRASYVYAVLECGHSAAVPLLPERYACMDCGHVRERTGPLLSPYCPECGCGAAKPVFRPDPHNAEHRLAAVGDKAECKDCDHYAAALQELRNLDRRGSCTPATANGAAKAFSTFTAGTLRARAGWYLPTPLKRRAKPKTSFVQ